jgi:hypothetical protein
MAAPMGVVSRPHAIDRLRARLGRGVIVSAVCSATVVTASAARAADVRTVTRTVGEGYMMRVPGVEGQLLSRRRLVQYVNLGVFRILPPKRAKDMFRDPRDGQLQIVTSLRVRHDFGTFQRNATGNAARLIENLDGRQIDILFGYLEGRSLGGWVDLRAGRQLEMSGLDFYAFDGGWVRLRTPAHLAVETFGGFQVNGNHAFGFPTFELDGTQGTPHDEASSPMVGAAFSLTDVSWMDARFAYRRTWTPSTLNADLMDVDGTMGLQSVVNQELVSANIALRLFDGRFSPFAAARYNMGTVRVDDLSAGVGWALTPMHTLRAFYLRTIPLFDLDSIFNVFATEPFEDVRVVYEVRPNERWTVYGRFQGRMFRSVQTQELGVDPDASVPFGGGGGAGAAYRRRRFAMRLDGFGLGGEGGMRAGGSVDTRTHVWYDRLALDGRAYYVHYRDDLVADRRGYSLALQVGTNIRLAHGVYFNVIGEELFTTFYRHAFRALGVLSVDWAFRVGQR